MKTRILILALAMLALSGCATTQFTAQDFKQPSLITEPQNDIALTAEFAAHRDTTSGSGSYSFPTGDLASRLFTGGNDAPAKLILVSSQLSIETRDEFPVPVFHTTARYHISCVLERGSTRLPMSASAEGKTSLNAAEAGREAIERALLDLSKQAQAVVKS